MLCRTDKRKLTNLANNKLRRGFKKYPHSLIFSRTVNFYHAPPSALPFLTLTINSTFSSAISMRIFLLLGNMSPPMLATRSFSYSSTQPTCFFSPSQSWRTRSSRPKDSGTSSFSHSSAWLLFDLSTILHGSWAWGQSMPQVFHIKSTAIRPAISSSSRLATRQLWRRLFMCEKKLPTGTWHVKSGCESVYMKEFISRISCIVSWLLLWWVPSGMGSMEATIYHSCCGSLKCLPRN